MLPRGFKTVSPAAVNRPWRIEGGSITSIIVSHGELWQPHASSVTVDLASSRTVAADIPTLKVALNFSPIKAW